MANVEDEKLAGEAGLTDEQVAQMQIPELKDELRRRRLRLAGRKRELVARLLAALRLEREHGAREDDPDDDDDDDSEDDDDDEIGVMEDRLDVNVPGKRHLNNQDGGVRVTPAIRRPRQDEPRGTVLTLKDVEDSLDKFSGDDLLSINRWVEDFEEMAEVCGWTDIHMVAFAKKLLTGSAQAFVRQERCTKSWAKLKKALKDEFENVVTDQQIHRELAHRKKKADESLQQYLYSMREIAGQGRVDMQSLIDYVIQGIPDKVTNKAVLYGARSMQELKERFKQYEAMKRDMKMEGRTTFEEQKSRRTETIAKPVRNEKNERLSQSGDAVKKTRCFNCGSEDHLSARCPEKEKGVKCFKCNEFGHIASKCDNLSESVKKVCNVLRLSESKQCKDVKKGKTYIREVEEKDCDRLPEVSKVDVEMRPDEVVDRFQSEFVSSSVVEKENESRHVPIEENSRKCMPVVVPTSVSVEDTAVMSESLLDESVTTNVTTVASAQDDTDGCDEVLVDRIEQRANRGVEQTRAMQAQDDADGRDKDFVGCIEYRANRTVEQTRAMQAQVVKQARVRGHFGITRTETIVKKDFGFRGLREKVERVISNYLDCIPAERKLGEPEGYLNPLDKGDKPLVTYHADHVGTTTKKRSTDAADVVERMKSENEAGTRKFEVVRKRVINPTSCRRTAFNKRRKKAKTYKTGDLVAIKKTRGGSGFKSHSEFLGPYRVVRTMQNDRYIVEKVGELEGPKQTSTAADLMKLWVINTVHDASDGSETADNI